MIREHLHDMLARVAERVRPKSAAEEAAHERQRASLEANKIPSLASFLDNLRKQKVAQTMKIVHDYRQRQQLKAEVLAKALKFGPCDLLQFHLDPKHPGLAYFAIICEEIRREHPSLTVIKWKKGNALCRTCDVDKLRAQDRALYNVNAGSGFIERGG